jgi:adenylate cyclase
MTASAAPAGEQPGPTLAQVAERAGVSAATVRRWVAAGIVPQYEGNWTAAAVGQVRVVARLRARGHALAEIRRASERGLLAVGDLEEFLPAAAGRRLTLSQAARASGLSRDVIERLHGAMGLSSLALEELTEDDLRILRDCSAILAAGLPLDALVQILRVYGQALAQIADAEVRLFHMYVHEPLMRNGVPGLQIAEQMRGLVGELLPFATPLMGSLHDRFLAHFVEQDIVGHMESEPDQRGLQDGRLRVTMAFADLAGYTRLADEHGDERAVSAVERFVGSVETTLPTDARVIKTLGDEVMIVGSNPSSLADWAVELQGHSSPEGPAPRIGIHHGEAIYRDGDYYGGEVNRAARVVARALGGEVLMTRPVVDALSPAAGLRVRLLGEVTLKGFSEPTELFVALGRR